MEIFKVENLSFTYPGKSVKALDAVTFTVNQGEFVVLCGKSGCGKTTLLRLLKSSSSPFGAQSGIVYFSGKPLQEHSTKEQAARIGFVMQSPENQIVTDKVWHELAFGLENLGYPQTEIRTRVSEMASFFGLEPLFHKKTSELAGGQKQLLNLAAVMVMQPSVLILDEPTGQLSPIAATEFLEMLERINRELGTTVILSEHRLEDVFPLCDRVIVMEEGKIIANTSPNLVGEILQSLNHDMCKALPTPMRVHGAVPNSLACPITIRDGRAWLSAYAKEHILDSDVIPKDASPRCGEKVIQTKDVWFRYEKELPDVIKGLDLTVRKGELFCLLGGNGTGKTTTLSLLSGLHTPYRGDIFIKGQPLSKIKNLFHGILGVLPQNPQSVFLQKTVYLDLMEMLSEKKIPKEEKEQKVQAIASLLRIETLLPSHPYDLSGGEQQRVALAKILLQEPEILLLDEPTKGMDSHFKEELADILSGLKRSGVTIVMVSHDIEFCAAHADRCALFFDGSITSEGGPKAFFTGNNFYTTSANRMARGILPTALLAEDIIGACGGRINKKEKHTHMNHTDVPAPPKPAAVKNPPPKTKKTAKRLLPANLLILFLIPLTIYIGVSFLDNRKYYFISLLIILETMIAFYMGFESRKPKAKEIVTISVLCALAVLARSVFFAFPQFKPVAAIVMIAGVCFGRETGFLVGAVTAFISNFFFGQGPWTPWQMFAFGIIGYLTGILFQKGSRKKLKAALCIFGFFATLLIYGGIMNPASIIMWQDKITWQMIASAYLAGLPLDLIHALSTAFFLWILAEPMIEKLERIKTKYGLIE